MEAARLREEKHKVEMERYTKELESLRWENMNSRRGEVEVGTWVLFFPFNFNLFRTVTTKLLDARHPLSNILLPLLHNESMTSELIFFLLFSFKTIYDI